jgi:tetratricopeptide (TPR) repeat protein
MPLTRHLFRYHALVILELAVLAIVLVFVVWLAAYMLAQKAVTTAQQLIQARRYEEAMEEAARSVAAAPNDVPSHLARADAARLLGRHEEALASYEAAMRAAPDDAAAREGVAVSLAWLGRDLDRARSLMEETIAAWPQIQEFQALALAFILLRRGERDEALRIFADNVELLETRFRDDYTDPDPLLAETLTEFAELSEAAGDRERAGRLRKQAAEWAFPSS